jgi:RimJ/RimL family protein N-acetyltransferase
MRPRPGFRSDRGFRSSPRLAKLDHVSVQVRGKAGLSEPSGSGVVLRPPGEADKRRLHGWRNAPELARWMYSDHEISPEEHERWYAEALSDRSRRYWIVEVDGTPAGLVNV